jgi:hypothetical protein
MRYRCAAIMPPEAWLTIQVARPVLAWLWIGMIVAVSGCDRPDPDEPVHVRVASVAVEPAAIDLPVGHTLRMGAILGDAAGNALAHRMADKPARTIADSLGRSGPVVTWMSDRPALVSVDAGGLVTAMGAGTATITATSDGRSGTARVTVTEPRSGALVMAPASAALSVGGSLQLSATVRGAPANSDGPPVTWASDNPSLATVDRLGLVTATGAGTATITATSGAHHAKASLAIDPVTTVFGLDFPGNAGVRKTMRFEFTPPMRPYPATYIWRAYPRQQPSYYTAFFWGNNGRFSAEETYYGFHPYPDWKSAYRHFWEIAAPPGGDFVSSTHVVYDRWYVQVAICRLSGERITHEFFWDWPDRTRVLRHVGERVTDPPVPVLVVGDAPWNAGHEVWDGVLRGFQFYDVALTEEDVAREIGSPGSTRRPWYVNLNPKPSDISNKSVNGREPAWVGIERPRLWTGLVVKGTIRTTVPPR